MGKTPFAQTQTMPNDSTFSFTWKTNASLQVVASPFWFSTNVSHYFSISLSLHTFSFLVVVWVCLLVYIEHLTLFWRTFHLPFSCVFFCLTAKAFACLVDIIYYIWSIFVKYRSVFIFPTILESHLVKTLPHKLFTVTLNVMCAGCWYNNINIVCVTAIHSMLLVGFEQSSRIFSLFIRLHHIQFKFEKAKRFYLHDDFSWLLKT